MMMCFIHKFIQSHYFVKLNVKECDVHRYIGESVFFHDRLIDLFVKEAEDSTKFGTIDRDDIHIIFDMRRTNESNHMCTFMYVGEYLTRVLQRIRRHPDAFFPNNVCNDEDGYERIIRSERRLSSKGSGGESFEGKVNGR